MSTWSIDPVRSVTEFKVKHMMVSNLKGQFIGVQGVLHLDESDLTNSHKASIDAISIDTRDAQRDAHLKNVDFFDVVERFPALSFQSTRISRTGDGELAVAGDLTIHGTTHGVVFKVAGPSTPGKDPWGSTRVGLSATTKINGKEFAVTWNTALETGGTLVGDQVTITLDVQFVEV
jgi:polyisoprenoid-binding protein YceI